MASLTSVLGCVLSLNSLVINLQPMKIMSKLNWLYTVAGIVLVAYSVGRLRAFLNTEPDQQGAHVNTKRWHILTGSEADRCRACVEQLSPVTWAKPLLKAIESNGGLLSDNARPLLFELRFAAEMANANIVPIYEFAGLEPDKIDFKLPGKPSWLTELVAIDETANLSEIPKYDDELVEGETKKGSGIFVRSLMIRSDAENQTHTGGWQMIKMQQKIEAKVSQDNKPHKFPTISGENIHAILIDTRGFGGGDGADIHALRQIVYGAGHGHQGFIEYFKDKPVMGLFDAMNTSAEAAILKERIHCLVFVNEKQFGPGTMWSGAHALWNPFLESGVRALSKSFPWPINHEFGEKPNNHGRTGRPLVVSTKIETSIPAPEEHD